MNNNSHILVTSFKSHNVFQGFRTLTQAKRKGSIKVVSKLTFKIMKLILYCVEKLKLRVCMFAHKSRRNKLICPKLGMLMPRVREEISESQGSEKVPWLRFLVKVVPVARKLSTIEEWRQDQSYLFRRGYYRNKGHNSEKLSWVRVPVWMVFGAQKLSTTEEWRQDQNVLAASARRL
jgi:hypothetical protein